jgi:site-specific recombinase XerD
MTIVESGFKYGNSRITPLVGKPDMPHMQEYLDELGAQLRSKDYIRVVRNGLIHFADYCHRENLIHPGELTRQHIIRYQALVTVNQAWGKPYQVQLMRYVRGWIRWMLALNYVHVDPWVSIKIGETTKLPKPLDEDEVTLLFQAHKQGAFSMSPFSFHRREMVLCLLFGWGLRTLELASLNTANMDTRLDFVTAYNKGGGTKSLPYSPEMKRVYQRYAALRSRFCVPGEDALIITQSGVRVTREQISKMMSELGSRAGISMNAHMLRDTAATTMLDGDIPVEQIAKILGHTSTKQTLRYAEVRNHKVAESHRRVMDHHLRVLFGSTSDLAS